MAIALGILCLIFLVIIFISFLVTTDKINTKIRKTNSEIKNLNDHIKKIYNYINKLNEIDIINQTIKIEPEKTIANKIKIEKKEEQKIPEQTLKKESEEKKSVSQEQVIQKHNKQEKEESNIIAKNDYEKQRQEKIKQQEEQKKKEQIELAKKKEREKERIKEKQEALAQEKIKKQEKNAKRDRIIKKFLQIFADHWIIIIASVVLVIGISFLGVFAFTILQTVIGPMHRFFMLVFVSIILVVASFVLQRFKMWEKLAIVTRSMSAALLLFACVGAAAIPGLNWLTKLNISNNLFLLIALLVICIGIFYNMLFAFIGRKQYLAILHTTLSLTAITIASAQGKSEITIIIACIITAAGIILTYWQKWEYHLMVAISLFFAYMMIWLLFPGEITIIHRITALSCITVIGLLTLLVHYRKIYSTPGFAVKPFITHMLNWTYFTINIVIFSPDFGIYKSIIIIGSAIAIFLISRLAKIFKIRWLYIADLLFSQIVAYTGIIILYDWNLQAFPIFSILFLESIAFTFIMLLEKEKFLYRMGIVIQNILAVIMIILNFTTINTTKIESICWHTIIMLLSTAAVITLSIVSIKRHNILFNINNEGSETNIKKIVMFYISYIVMTAALILVNIIILIFKNSIFIKSIPLEYILLASTILFIFARRKIQNNILKIIDSLIALGLSYVSCLFLLRWNTDIFIIFSIMFIVTLIFSSIMLARKDKKLCILGIILQTILTIIMVILNFMTINTLKPVITGWHSIIMLLSAAAIIIFSILTKKQNNTIFKIEESELNIKKINLTEILYLGVIGILISANIFLMIFNKSQFIQKIPVEYMLLTSSILFIFSRKNLLTTISGTIAKNSQSVIENINNFKAIDSLIILGLSYASCLFLLRWNIDVYLIFAIMFAITLVFSTITLIRKEKLIYEISNFFQNMISIIFIIANIVISLINYYTDLNDVLKMYKQVIITFSAVILLVLFNIFFLKKKDNIFEKNKFTGKKYLEFFYLVPAGLLLIVNIIFISLFKHINWIKNFPVEYFNLSAVLLFLAVDRKIKIKQLKNLMSGTCLFLTYIACLIMLVWEIPIFLIFSLMFITTLCYLVIFLITDQKIMYNICTVSFNILGIILIIVNFVTINTEDLTSILKNSILLGIILISGISFLIYNHFRQKKLLKDENYSKSSKNFNIVNSSISGIIIALIPFILYLNLFFKLPWPSYIGAEYIILLPVICLLFIRNKLQMNGIGIGLIISVFAINLTNILVHYANFYNAAYSDIIINNFTIIKKLIFSLPLIIIAITSIKFSKIEIFKKHAKWPGIYLLYINIAFLIYFMFNKISNLIPGAAWLIIAVITFEIASIIRTITGQNIRKKGRADLYLIFVSYAYIIAFIFRYFLAYIQSNAVLWIIPYRFLMELLALSVFLYIFFHKINNDNKPYKIIKNIQPLFLEISGITVFLIIINLLGRTYDYFITLIFPLTGIIYIILGTIFKQKLGRLKFYSLILFWISLFNIAFNSFKYNSGKITSFDLSWIIYLISIISLFAYITVLFRFKDIYEMKMPLIFFNPIIKFLQKRMNLFIFYPLLISITFFIIWSFKIKYYPFFFTAEAFMLFILSLILREKHYWYVSMLGILISLGFLIVVTFSNQHILIKALICIGVGLILAAMYIINTIFSKRFKKENDK